MIMITNIPEALLENENKNGRHEIEKEINLKQQKKVKFKGKYKLHKCDENKQGGWNIKYWHPLYSSRRVTVCLISNKLRCLVMRKLFYTKKFLLKTNYLYAKSGHT